MIPILFEDGEALVIDKPGGLPIERPRKGGPSLEDRLDELKLGFRMLPVPVHRIDTDTSGCLLLARNADARALLQRAFEGRAIQKYYLAVIGREIAEEAGEIDLPLAKQSSAEAGWKMVGDPAGQSAVTRWRRLTVRDGRTLVEFRPVTGRTHQIRVHAASGLGAPVVGDGVYGKADGLGMMLHAQRLIVPRPGKPDVLAEAPLPERFAKAGFADEATLVANAAPVAEVTTLDSTDD